MSQFDITQPFSDNIEEGSVETYRSANKRNDNPRLACIVCFGDLPPPFPLSSA
jgi:hypothetical protein